MRVLIVSILIAFGVYAQFIITERKRAEKALQKSEERFRRLSEASFEGIMIHDEGKIIDVNQAFAAMFGYDLSEVIGRNALDFATPELREVALRHIRTGSEEPYEGIAIRKDGSTFPVKVQGRNIPYKGQTVRVIAMGEITERKRAEEERERRSRELAMLNEIGQAVTSSLDLNQVLGLLLDRARQELGAEACSGSARRQW